MKVIKVEIWKDIPGYECLYQASMDSQIRSVNTQQTNSVKYGRNA